MTLDISKYPTLALANTPDELRSLPKEMLPNLCDELRTYLLNSVSQSSGHLASGLGTVELTVALHYVYNTPFDQLVWDVGHQAYPHKILTGRRDQMPTIRQRTVSTHSHGAKRANTTPYLSATLLPQSVQHWGWRSVPVKKARIVKLSALSVTVRLPQAWHSKR